MPIKPLCRLMFVQGGMCFFCNNPLPRSEASVEHLVPISRNGSNSDDNCVACCKSINRLLGSMSLKEKLRVVLLQKGDFICPMQLESLPVDASAAMQADHYSLVLEHLTKNIKSRPQKLQTLKNSIRAKCNGAESSLTENQLESLIQQLKANRKITIVANRVFYWI